MRTKPGLFLAIAASTTAVLLAVWVFMTLTGGRGQTVPEGETRTSGGVVWHLDWVELIEPDDPSLKDTYLDVIDGAIYVVAQFTFEAVDPTNEVMICRAEIVGDSRQWIAHGVKPVSEATDRWCQPQTGATVQVVATVPPSVVAEIQGVDVSFEDRTIRLLGHVR